MDDDLRVKVRNSIEDKLDALVLKRCQELYRNKVVQEQAYLRSVDEFEKFDQAKFRQDQIPYLHFE